jgi:hypothetical protein
VVADDLSIGISGRRVTDRTAECAATNRLMPSLKHLRYLVIHETSLARQGPDNPHPVPDDQLDGMTLARIFRENPKPRPEGLGTGGWCPYHILISPGGRIEQLMPLRARGAHAVGYNSQSIGIALVGNFAKREPLVSQMRALVKVCAELVPINKGLVIGGHTVTFNASSDPGKVCPGAMLHVPDVARRVVEKLPPNWRTHTDEELSWLLKLGGYVA